MPYSAYSRLPSEFNLKMLNGSSTVWAMMYFKKVGISLCVLKTLFLLHHAWQLHPLSTWSFAIQVIHPLSSFPSKRVMAVQWCQPHLGWYLVKLQYSGCHCSVSWSTSYTVGQPGTILTQTQSYSCWLLQSFSCSRAGQLALYSPQTTTKFWRTLPRFKCKYLLCRIIIISSSLME